MNDSDSDKHCECGKSYRTLSSLKKHQRKCSTTKKSTETLLSKAKEYILAKVKDATNPPNIRDNQPPPQDIKASAPAPEGQSVNGTLNLRQ